MSGTDDKAGLRAALLAIRKNYPSAETAVFQTSDQDWYGFNLEKVILTGGGRLSEQVEPSVFGQLCDDVWGDVCDIDWDGVMGEDYGGQATIDISSFLAATSEPDISFPTAIASRINNRRENFGEAQ